MIKSLIRVFAPPILMIIYRKLSNINYRLGGFKRGFKNWKEALENSTSYSKSDVFEKTLNSARLVRDSKAVYERDSVIFDKIHYDYKLLSALLLIANTQNRLHIVDFGGALGTSYMQNKKYLDKINTPIKWEIVEQGEFVRIGRNEFQNDILTFNESLSCIKFPIDVILLAGSICYLEEPYSVLDEIKLLKPKFILIARTPFSNSTKDKISVQIVPKYIYKASYPIWTFSESKFINYLSDIYEVFESWEDDLQADDNAYAKGYLLQLKDSV